jgi:hypothetical protein
MKYNLPKPHISYSQYVLWKSSKDGYRKRYYLKEEPFKTVETEFGKKTDAHLDGGGKIEGIIEYSHNQYRIEVEYKGLRILGYLDGFDEETFRILERKTGHKNPKGKVPWDRMKVRRHKQLVFYSAIVELKHGSVHPEVILQWLETEFQEETREFDGHTLKTKGRNLKLTGNIETFKREIKNWEKEKMLEDILLVAEEITADYLLWNKTK